MPGLSTTRSVLLTFFFSFSVCVSAAKSNDEQGQEIAVAAQAYEWVNIKEPAGRFLLPVDWHLKLSKGKLLGSFVVRQASPDDDQDRHKPQLSVNPISLARMHHGLLSAQIGTYIAAIKADTGKTVELVEPVRFGQFEGSAVQFKAELDGQVQRFHRYYIADDRTNMLLVMTFRAKLVHWDAVWKIGQTMMTNFELNSDIRAYR